MSSRPPRQWPPGIGLLSSHDYPRGLPPIILKIGEVQPNLEFQPKLDFIMW
jgi:hypothetical protein